MSTNSTGSKTPIETPRSQAVDMRLEIVVIPVSDVDRAKRFYGGLGWRLDADFAAGDDFRVIQFTPPGSGCSVIFGKNVTAAAAGSARGLYLIVSDIEAARAELLDRGVDVSEAFHGAGNVYTGVDEPYLFGRLKSVVRIPSIAVIARSRRSAMQTATARCSRKSPRDYPDGWTRTARHSPPQPSSRSHSDVPRPHTASTRSGAARAMRIGRTGTPNTSSASRLAKSCRHEQRLRLPCQSARFRGLKRSWSGWCSAATRQFGGCPVFALSARSPDRSSGSRLGREYAHARGGAVVQSSTCSDRLSASSTSIPR